MALHSAKDEQKQFQNVIGGRIRDARSAKELTQDKLAQVIKQRMGACSRQAVAQWERGVAMPSYSMMPEIARALGVSPAWLAFGMDTDDVMGSGITKSSQATALVTVPHITFGDNLADRRYGTSWGIPKTSFDALGADSDKVFVSEITGQAVSERYDQGELVFIDEGDQRPDGSVMAYWDGMGLAFAFMAMVPSKSNPKVKLTGQGIDFETEIDDLEIIGKVKGMARLGV